MNPIKKIASLLAALLLSASALAAPVTLGQLSRDSGSSVIADRLNQRDWLGWDISKGYTLARLTLELGAGGLFDGYRIADRDDAALFMKAAGAGACGPSYPYDSCLVSPSLPGLGTLVGSATTRDFFGRRVARDSIAYLDESSANGAGVIFATDLFGARETFSSLTNKDHWGTRDMIDSQLRPSWLLYRAQDGGGTVPEPAGLGLSALALAAMAWAGRRRPGTSTEKARR